MTGSRIWCSPDRAKAWEDWMLYGREPQTPGSDCATPMEQIAQAAKALAVKGTPGLVFENGKAIAGAINTQEIEGLLKAAAGS